MLSLECSNLDGRLSSASSARLQQQIVRRRRNLRCHCTKGRHAQPSCVATSCHGRRVTRRPTQSCACIRRSEWTTQAKRTMDTPRGSATLFAARTTPTNRTPDSARRIAKISIFHRWPVALSHGIAPSEDLTSLGATGDGLRDPTVRVGGYRAGDSPETHPIQPRVTLLQRTIGRACHPGE